MPTPSACSCDSGRRAVSSARWWRLSHVNANSQPAEVSDPGDAFPVEYYNSRDSWFLMDHVGLIYWVGWSWHAWEWFIAWRVVCYVDDTDRETRAKRDHTSMLAINLSTYAIFQWCTAVLLFEPWSCNDTLKKACSGKQGRLFHHQYSNLLSRLTL